MGKLISIGSLIFFAAFNTSAQQYLYTLRNYTAIDGLPQSQVNVVLEDKNGYLWVGTQGGGLAGYDGREFKVYTTLDGLLSNIVTYLKLDSKNNLWVVHPRGISKFDGISFKKFVQPGGEKSMRVRKLFEVNDTLFIVSAPGNLGKIYRDSVYLWAGVTEKKKMLLYSHVMPNKEVLLYLGDSSFIVKGREGQYSFSHKNSFNRLYTLFNYNKKVIAKTDTGYFEIDAEKKNFKPIDIPLKNNFIFYDSANEVFWSRNRNSLLREYVVNNSLKIDTVVKEKEVSQVLVDSEMNTWIGTMGNGLYKYYIQDFDRCSSKNMQFIMAINKDSDGASWIGSQINGLWRIGQNKITHFFNKDDRSQNAIHCVTESPDKQVWIGTSGGLGMLDESTDKFKFLTRSDGLTHNSIGSIQFDEKGGMWIGTFGGGINYLLKDKYTSITVQQGLPSNAVTSMHYSLTYKKLFYGSEYGLGVINKGAVRSIQIPGAENSSVLSINPYQDSLLLIGTSGAGVAVYSPKSERKRLLTVYDGLPSGFIYFVAADPSNYVWIGSEKGITRIKLDDTFEIIESINYGFENGLDGVETNQNAFYLSEKEKYFGLLDGLYQFNEREKGNSHTFDLHLTSVELSYGEFDARNFSETTNGFFGIPMNPIFDPDKNTLTFKFNRVNKQYPKSVRYKYFLQNYDKKWSKPSSNNSVTYSNLPPGEYSLKIMATDANGGWTGSSLYYPFTIKTPFYLTAGFIVGSVITFISAIIFIFYLRVRARVERTMVRARIREQEQENLRKEIARDFHDEMGNQLTRIINYVSLLRLNGSIKYNEEGYSQKVDLYSKVEDSAKYLYNGTRDFIWAIDPVNDELSKLFLHIRDFGEKLFEEKGIHFRAQNSVKGKVKLPYGFSREANLIFKEAMTNTFKSSHAKNAMFSLQQNNGLFELTFNDDGIGFDVVRVESLNGLKNIRERANKIGSILRIHSKPGGGTTISLSFRLTKTKQYDTTI